MAKNHKQKKTEKAKAFQWQDLAWPVGISLGLTIIFSVLGLIYFETSDDVATVLMLSGSAIVSEPTSWVVYLYHLPAFVLKSLYQFVPHFPWYAVFLLIPQVIFFSLFLFFWFDRFKSPKNRALGVSLAGLLFMIFSATLTYSYSAFLSGLAGVMLFEWNRSRNLSQLNFIALLLVTTAAAIRFPMFLLVTGTYLVKLAVEYFLDKKFPLQKKQLVLMVVTIFISGSFFGLNQVFYRSNKEWKEFISFNALRGQILDFSNFKRDSLIRSVQKLGWSNLDYQLLRAWMLADEEKFNKKSFSYFVKNTEREALGLNSGLFQQQIRELYTEQRFWLFVALLLISLSLVPASRKRLLGFSSIAMLCILVGVGLATVGRLIPRAFYPLFALWMLWAPILVLSDKKFKIWDSHFRRLTGILGLAVAAWALIGFLQYSAKRNSQGKAFEASVAQLKNDQGIFYVGWKLPITYLRPFSDVQEIFRGVNIIPMGGLTQSPHYHQALRQNGVKNFFQDMTVNPKMYVIASDYQRQLLKQQLQQKLKKPVNLPVVQKNQFFTVVKPEIL